METISYVLQSSLNQTSNKIRWVDSIRKERTYDKLVPLNLVQVESDITGYLNKMAK